MSEQSHPHQVVNIQQPQSNGLGVAGFVVSLVGWFTCGGLCPLGMILSFFAMFKEPRGLAIAGFIIGLLGSGFLLLFGLAFILAMIGVGTAAAITMQMMQMAVVEGAAMQYYNANGVLPTESQLVAEIGPDGLELSGVQYRLVSDTEFEIVTAGPDKQLGTADDSVYLRDVSTSDGDFVSGPQSDAGDG